MTMVEAPAPPRPDRGSVDRWSWGVLLILGLAFLVFALLQAPGKIVADTKLDLAVAPWTFLRRSLHLWESNAGLGQIQDQAYGYLFPMGPFFLVLRAIHIPVWIVQRLWVAVLFSVAAWGLIRLAEALGIGSRSTRMAAAVAFALSPLAASSGNASPKMLSVSLLPWMILPLVHGARGGSVRRAAALSGIAFAFTGGINAAIGLSVLFGPALWLVTRERTKRTLQLAGWWLVSVALASVWWAIPLLVMSKYGLNFVKYTETAKMTTDTASAFEALRGGSNWLGYFNLGRPWLPAGWAMSSWVIAILATAILAAIGLYGIARKDIPERIFLASLLFLGVLLIAVGYGGTLGGPFAHWTRSLGNGPLAAFRNVSKFAPLVSLALVLGLAHGLVVMLQRRPSPQLWWRPTAAIALVVVLALALSPFVAGFFPDGSMSKVPHYWTETAQWLDSHAGDGAGLLLPSSPFGEYTWGRPLDEPMQYLAKSRWAVRNLIPLGGVGSTRWLDEVERVIETDQASPTLADTLARGGIAYLIVRNDLDFQRSSAPRPLAISDVLRNVPGIVKVKDFGPTLRAPKVTPTSVVDLGLGNVESSFHSVEIYQITRPVEMVRTYPVAGHVVVSGSSDTVPLLTEAGLLDGQAAVLAGDGPTAGQGASPVYTDNLRRRDVEFGLVRRNASYVLAAGEKSPDTHQTPKDRLVVSGAAHQTVALPVGAASVASSTYGAIALARDPADQPANAFDGDPSTYWVTSFSQPTGQWTRIDFATPVDVSHLTISLLAEGPWRPLINEVKVTTDQGSLTTRLAPGEQPQTIATAAGSTRFVKVTLTKVAKAQQHGSIAGPGIRDIAIPGVTFHQTLQLPSDLEGVSSGLANPTYLFDDAVTNGNEDLGYTGDEDPHMTRMFTVPGDAQLQLDGTVTGRPSRALDDALSGSGKLVIEPSSVLGDLPKYRAANLLGNDFLANWVAAVTDRQPALDLSWPDTRTIDSVVVTGAIAPSSSPQVMRIESPAGSRDLDLTKGGTIKFPLLTTERLHITFPKVAVKMTINSFDGTKVPLPVGLGKLSFPALADLVAPPPATTTPFDLPCGGGPTLVFDNHAVSTEVHGTLDDLVNLRPLPLTPCGQTLISLTKGQHVFEAHDQGLLKVTRVVMHPADVFVPSTSQGTGGYVPSVRAVEVGTFNDAHRKITVGPGPDAYLVIRENFSKGWKATLGGHTLLPVRIDGWQQGWVVPANVGGVVNIRMGPDRVFRGGLLVGALLLVVLVALAAVPSRSRASDTPPVGPAPGPGTGVILLIVGIVLLAVGGPLVVLLPIVVFWRRLRPYLTWIAAGSFVAAGIAAAAQPGPQPGSGRGAFGWPAQVLTVLALAALGAALADWYGRSRGSGSQKQVTEHTTIDDKEVATAEGAPTPSAAPPKQGPWPAQPADVPSTWGMPAPPGSSGMPYGRRP